jgi:hypothetical protein
LKLLLLLLLAPSPALAAKRIALVVGNNRADTSRVPLRYAERDARQMTHVLESLGGVSRVHLLLDRSAADLSQAIDEVRSDLASGDTVFFFYSGHADDRALLMRDTRFTFEELRSSLKSLPTALFVAFIDACQAGGISRLKGGTAVPIVDVDLYADGGPQAGGIFITSGAPGENAQESDELEASFFTHYLISGLRGAADDSGDRRVSLDEAYRFAYRHTLDRTQGTLLGPQHPTYDVDVRGRGQLVLTWLTERESYLILPEGSSGTYYLRADHDDELIAEVTKREEERLRIAVDPGRYEIAKAEAGFLLSQTVVVGAKSELEVEERRMSARPLARVHSKGAPLPSTSGFSVIYRLRTGYLRDAAPAHGLGALYLLDLEPMRLGPMISWGTSSYTRDDGIRISTSDLEIGLRIGATWYVWPRVGLFAGAELAVSWTTQRGLIPGDSERIHAFTFPERAVAGLEIELFSPFALILFGHAGVVAYDTPNGPAVRFTSGAAAGFELRL